MPGKFRATLVGVLLATGMLAAPAGATIVSAYEQQSPPWWAVLFVDGEPGEVNDPQVRSMPNPLGGLARLIPDLSVQRTLGLTVVPDGLLRADLWVEIRDDGNPLRVRDTDQRRCAAAHSRVYCGIPSDTPGRQVLLFLGDRNDRLGPSSLVASYHVDGEAGDDHIVGPAAATHLFAGGGDGTDLLETGAAPQSSLHGGAGDDVLRGGAGPDRVDGGLGSDILSGGAGTDLGFYWFHDAAVHVTIDDQANDGMPGEGDDVRSDVEDLTLTSFDDVAVGSAAANHFEGDGGGDVLDGGAGADVLEGGSGGDDLTGGPGADEVYGHEPRFRPVSNELDDVLRLDDGESDRYACGRGNDTADVDAFDVFGYLSDPAAPLDCEVIL